MFHNWIFWVAGYWQLEFQLGHAIIQENIYDTICEHINVPLYKYLWFLYKCPWLYVQGLLHFVEMLGIGVHWGSVQGLELVLGNEHMYQ